MPSSLDLKPQEVVETAIEQLSEARDDGISYINSNDIRDFLQIIEIQLDIDFEREKIWSITDSFIDKYQNLLIKSTLFIQFLNDLYKLDLLELINDQVLRNKTKATRDGQDHRAFRNVLHDNNPVNESSPAIKMESSPFIKNESPVSVPRFDLNEYKSFEDEDIRSLQNRIEDKFKNLFSPTATKKKKIENTSKHSPILGSSKATLNFETSQTQGPPQSKFSPVSLIALVISSINIILLGLVITVLLLISNGTTRRAVIQLFLNNETSDLYWWQRVPFLERHIWEILELLRSYEAKGQ